MVDIVAEKIDDVYMKLHCENEGVAMELGEYFSFYAKNYQFSPKFQNELWDGKIRLFHLVYNTLFIGLVYELIRYCIDRELSLTLDPALGMGEPPEPLREDFIPYLNLPFEPYDYQIDGLNLIVQKKRRLILSPTASGKSLILYMAARYLLETKKVQNLLIIVPTTSLVEQMVGDFKDYAVNSDWDADKWCHKIYDYDGMTKKTKKRIVVTTWHSVYKEPKAFFKCYNAVFVDEAHQAQANSITSIMKKLTKCPYRIGVTGTIEDTETHKLTLTGLFGKVYQTTTTRKLMDRELVSDLQIKCLMLQYPEEESAAVNKMKYPEEIETIIADERRNKFIHKLATTRPGNVLVLFNRVEKHGVPLFERMEADSNGRKIFVVHGKIKVEEREYIRAYAETHDNVVIAASYGTFSTGINIKNLQYVIFAHPYKAKIKNLQSIGRSLRISTNGQEAWLYDISDDYRWKTMDNHTLKHFKIRLQIYDKEGFDYSLIPMEI